MNELKLLKRFSVNNKFLDPIQNKIKDFNVKQLIEQEELFELFIQHCKKENSLESILFIQKVNVFKTLSFQERVKKAFDVHQNFLAVGSKFELNISREQERKILKQINETEVPIDIFDGLYKTVEFNLKDIWSRFLLTDGYLNFKPKKKVLDEKTLEERFEHSYPYSDSPASSSSESPLCLTPNAMTPREDQEDSKNVLSKVVKERRKSRKLSQGPDFPQYDKINLRQLDKKTLEEKKKSPRKKIEKKKILEKKKDCFIQ